MRKTSGDRVPIVAVDAGVVVRCLIVAGASSNEIVGIHGDRVKIRVSAPPERGRANDAAVSLLVAATGAGSGSVVSGRTSRVKSVLLSDITVATAKGALAAG